MVRAAAVPRSPESMMRNPLPAVEAGAEYDDPPLYEISTLPAPVWRWMTDRIRLAAGVVSPLTFPVDSRHENDGFPSPVTAAPCVSVSHRHSHVSRSSESYEAGTRPGPWSGRPAALLIARHATVRASDVPSTAPMPRIFESPMPATNATWSAIMASDRVCPRRRES